MRLLNCWQNLIILGTVVNLKGLYSWLFAVPQTRQSWWKVIAWWEIRRIPYNLIIAVYGFVCLMIFFWTIITSGRLQEGEDAIEPIVLLAAPFIINICYTFGWLSELAVRLVGPSLSNRFSPILLKIGIIFSMFIISIPALIWSGYRLLQAVNVIM